MMLYKVVSVYVVSGCLRLCQVVKGCVGLYEFMLGHVRLCKAL